MLLFYREYFDFSHDSKISFGMHECKLYTPLRQLLETYLKCIPCEQIWYGLKFLSIAFIWCVFYNKICRRMTRLVCFINYWLPTSLLLIDKIKIKNYTFSCVHITILNYHTYGGNLNLLFTLIKALFWY